MTIIDSFLKNIRNKEIKEEKAFSNIKVVKEEKSNNYFVNTLQKQVIDNKKTSNVETAIRPGDGLGMNTKIEG